MTTKTIYDITVVVEQDTRRISSVEDIKTAVCNDKYVINSIDKFIDGEWETGASLDEKTIVFRERKLDVDGNEFIIEKEVPIKDGISLLNNITLQ